MTIVSVWMLRGLAAAGTIAGFLAPALAQNPPAIPVERVEAAPLDASGPERIEGSAVALDARAMLIGDTQVRLYGLLSDDDTTVAALRGRLALEALLAEGEVSCHTIDRDRDGTLRAVCEGPGGDLALSLIGAGAGLPARLDTYSSSAPSGLGARYDEAEAKARASGSGIWAAFAPPPRPENDRPNWMPRSLWRMPAGLGALIGAALGFLGLAIVALALGRRRRERPESPARP
jgi:hypothetical protein